MAIEDQDVISTAVDPVLVEPRPRRRLSLVWQLSVEEPGEVVPSGSNARFMRVRRAMQQERCVERHHTVHVAAESIRLLASRVGPHDSEDIPREIRRHQWSALNVLLLWSAAEGDFDNPMVRWLVEESERLPTVIVAGVQMSGFFAAVTMWGSLRDVLHSRGFGTRAQERLLNLAIADNASVSGLESLFDQMTLAECRRQVAPVGPGLVNNSDHAEHPNAFQCNRAEIPVRTLSVVGKFSTASICGRLSSGGVLCCRTVPITWEGDSVRSHAMRWRHGPVL